MKLRNKVVVVTGAARGLGRFSAKAIRNKGATVIGLDIIAPEVSGEMDAFHLVDLTDQDEVKKVAALIQERFGDIDVLVNNAGVLSLEKAESGVTEEVRRAIDVNLFGAWNLTAAMLPGLLRKRGKVVNVSSLFALVNAPYVAAYAASKRAIFAFSDVLRMQHRGKLNVVTAFPGFINTAIHTPAEQVGLSVRRLVSFKLGDTTLFSLEEKIDDAAAGLVRACESNARNTGLTLLGTLTMYSARFVPSIVDWFISWRLSTLVRTGHLNVKAELIH